MLLPSEWSQWSQKASPCCRFRSWRTVLGFYHCSWGKQIHLRHINGGPWISIQQHEGTSAGVWIASAGPQMWLWAASAQGQNTLGTMCLSSWSHKARWQFFLPLVPNLCWLAFSMQIRDLETAFVSPVYPDWTSCPLNTFWVFSDLGQAFCSLTNFSPILFSQLVSLASIWTGDCRLSSWKET